MQLSPGLGLHLRALADVLLVEDFPGSTLRRSERELIATAVSATNGCFFCMDTHGAFAAELLRREGYDQTRDMVESMKLGICTSLDPRLRALTSIAHQVAQDARLLGKQDVDAAKEAGATDGDVQLAILIASAFCMYNRMVDGLRAKTPPDPSAYDARAREVVEYGYGAAHLSSIPALDA